MPCVCFFPPPPPSLSPSPSPCLSQTEFPLAEFIMASGFFTVLILERLVLTCSRPQSDEHQPLLSNHGHGHGGLGYAHAHGQGNGTISELEGSGGRHVHVDRQAHSSFRSFILFLSLSLHSVFEGLAIGLQTTESKVRLSRL